MAVNVGNAVLREATERAVPPPVYKPEEYTVAGVVLKFFEEKTKDIAKAFSYGSFWIGQAIPNLPAGVKSFGATMGEFKNFVSMTEVPKKGTEAWASYAALWAALGSADAAWKAAGEAFKKTTGLINAVIDSIDFSSRFAPIDSATMTAFKGVNFAATLGGAAKSASEQMEKYSKAQPTETAKTHFYTINFLRDASYTTLGGYGLGCIVTATALNPLVMVGILTSGLSFTIGSYFYEKLYDPEGKGKNLNPETVIENHLARKRYEQQLAGGRP